MKLDEIINFLKAKFSEFQTAEKRNFKDLVKYESRGRKGEFRGRKGVLEYPGCYVIYEGDKPIYVGSAGKGGHVLKYRMGDLFFHTPRSGYGHNLSRKLTTNEKHKRFKNKDELREFYLNECSVKIIRTNNKQQAQLVESALILHLNNPRYNE